jgi:hypothetical protein
MVDLSKLIEGDPTLEAADAALVARSLEELPRLYLGMSSIGESCSRKSWYRFRFAGRETFDALTLKRFADGHRTEALVIERLKMVDGVTVIDLIDGEQIGFSDLEGHFSGHADGEIIGILQAPKTPHILEVKCVEEKSFNKLKKLVSDVGEKQALRAWNSTYWTQGQLYCHYRSYKRHYLVVSTPGGRDWMGVRTDYDMASALREIEKARRIIKAQEPPERIGDESYFECKWCQFNGICHKDEFPDRSCRTCVHSTPIEEGNWHCDRWGKNLTLQEQIDGCPAHLLLPSMVAGEIIEVNQEKNFIRYKMKNGSEWVDSEQG